MNELQTAAPILSEQSLLWIAGGTIFVVLFTGVILAIILKNTQDGIQAIRGGRALEHVTVFTVIFSALILGLERVLTGEAVAGILGGIVGYVLGSMKKSSVNKAESSDS